MRLALLVIRGLICQQRTGFEQEVRYANFNTLLILLNHKTSGKQEAEGRKADASL